MCEETFIAQRLVNDHVKAVGGVMGVAMTKELLASWTAARGMQVCKLPRTDAEGEIVISRVQQA